MNAKAYSVSAATKVASIGRTSVYKAISKGQLRAQKFGTRTVILEDELERWLNSLPALKPSKQNCG